MSGNDKNDDTEKTFIQPVDDAVSEKPTDQPTFISDSDTANLGSEDDTRPAPQPHAAPTFIKPVEEANETDRDGDASQPTVIKPAATEDTSGGATFIPDDDARDSFAPTFVGGSAILEDQKGARILAGLGDAQTSSAIGGRIGEYRIDAELGRGGMGVVYKAHHTQLRRDVAIKMILNGAHTSPESLQRFIVEARAVAHLQHPNIVQIFDIGEHDGLPFFSLEFVKGSDLQDLLDGKPQPPHETAKLVSCLALAMQYAHDQGIVHRDLKPANVLISEKGVPKISDFGLAKELEDNDSGSTRDGTIMGSPSYMSPEQAGGHIADIGPPTDQYSLGAILYQMLTGRPPFAAAKAIDTVMQVVNNEPVPPRQLQPEIPLDLETICLKTLQKDKAGRYDDCGELAADLQRFMNGEPILARPIGRIETAWRWCKRNPKLAVSSFVALALLCTTAVVSTWSYFTVSSQAVTIKQERDNAVKQERIALTNEQLAKTNEKRAIDGEELAKVNEQRALDSEQVARKQADITLKNLQAFVSKIDDRLAKKPDLKELRVSILDDVSAAWNDIDVSVREDKLGQAIPTRMAVRFKLSMIYKASGELQKAYDEAKKLYAIGNERIEIKGGNDATRLNQAKISMLLMADLRKQLDRDIDACLAHNLEAVKWCQQILSDPKPEPNSPTQKEIRSVLSESLQRTGVEYISKGQLPIAADYFREALELRREDIELIKSSDGYAKLPKEEQFQKTAEAEKVADLSTIGLAYILLRMGNKDDALPMYEIVHQNRRRACELAPDQRELKRVFAGTIGTYGNALQWEEQPVKALELYNESLRLMKEVFAEDPANHVKKALATAHFRLGTLLDSQGQPDDAKQHFEDCRKLRAQMAESGSSTSRQDLMVVLARLGEFDEAQKLESEFAASKLPDPEVHLYRARCLAQLSRHAEPDDVDRLQTAAIDALAKAIADGYADPYKIRVEPDFAPIRADERFKAAIDQMLTEIAETSGKA
jgi:serine/threonine protein kinase/tetratricopeptide (TPR) repeat protein